ncbi:MAG: PilZ domain-containing protein [Bradyrhizobium sp.]|uniref:PilZ domain-containing protein n=1 Tax=Bradyrhizobium sp. TaxID=376 RepID=UPI001223108F|nr:PilZ domain-containing protein [Bradyrhizobium sp.]THD52105.1 MAG: PilZ domain-containing protein [Bradyrhizobium sp.]
MVETRAGTRYRVMKPARIEHRGERVNCMIRDLSLTGASLEVTDPARIPANFTLVVPEDGLKLSCRIVRRTVFRIGVAFD